MVVFLRMLRARSLGYNFERNFSTGERDRDIHDRRTGKHIGGFRGDIMECYFYDGCEEIHDELKDALTDQYNWRAAFGLSTAGVHDETTIKDKTFPRIVK